HVEDLLDKLSPATEKQRQSSALNRRNFLKIGAITGAGASALGGAGASLLGTATTAEAETSTSDSSVPHSLNEVTIAKLQAMMKQGSLSSVQLVDYYLRRIGKLD